MDFLLNMNAPRALIGMLSEQGHHVRHAGDVGLAKAPDTAVVDHARQHGEVIVTHDLDYGNVLAFSGERSPSVIISRLAKPSAQGIASSIVRAWDQIAAPLREGAIVILEDINIRIRKLPIASR